MSKYIDERPFEDVIRAVTLDDKHKEHVDAIVSMILADEACDWRHNPLRGDHTIYDAELIRMRREKVKLDADLEQAQKYSDTLFNKILELTEPDEGEEEEEEEEEEEQADDYVDHYQEKGKGNQIKLKPAELAKKKKQDAIARQNFKSSLATLQEQMREMMKRSRELDKQIDRHKYFQEVSVKVLISLRRIVKHYKQNHDLEFVKKGVYFVHDHSSMLMDRYDRSVT